MFLFVLLLRFVLCKNFESNLLGILAAVSLLAVMVEF